MRPGLSPFSPPALLAVIVPLLVLFFSVDAFKAPNLKELPKRIMKGTDNWDVEKMWFFFMATKCPDSAYDSKESNSNNNLNMERIVLFYTDTSTSPPKIAGRITWDLDHGKHTLISADDKTMVNATYRLCGKCSPFTLSTTSIYDRFIKEAYDYPKLEKLHKENNLGFEFFLATTRSTGTLGDNEVNYQYDPVLEYKPIIDGSGTKNRYEEGGIHYKSFKIVGFVANSSGYDKVKEYRNSVPHTLLDVENDCSLVDPRQYIPSHGFYRLMIDENSNPVGKEKTPFWWRSQYYWPINGDFFT